MRLIAITFIALSSLLLTSCLCNKVKDVKDKMGDATRDIKNTKEVLENYKDIGKNVQKSMDKMEELAEKRRERGDTVAMKYQTMAEWMPEIEGYTKLDPKGQRTKMAGISYSTLTQRYERMAEDGSKDFLEIQLIDYNGSPSMYSMATALLNTDMEIDSDSETLRSYPIDIENVSAMETHKKKTGKTTITTGIAYRFFGTVKADSREDAVKALESLPLKDMSKL